MNNEDFKKGFMIVNGSKIEPLPKDLFDVPSKEREEEIIKYMSNKIVEDWTAKYGNNPEVDKIVNERLEYMAKIKTTIKKDSPAADIIKAAKEEKQAFKEAIESGNSKQQTAVMALAKAFREWQKEWDRFDKEKTKQPKSFDEFIQPFLEMEKEQLNIARLDGINLANKGYGSKGSDDKKEPKDIVLGYKTSLEAQMLDSQLPQTEISDEEIEKAAKECVYEDLDISVGSFELGARWYREQLKKK